jgi:glycosyltransferase involved in cell wall biosynthesis
MITVVIPAYNAMDILPACLQALQRQTIPVDEIIVVDDGSTDQTKQMAQENGARVLEQHHSGPAAARNLGIEKAGGEIILFTDADCEAEADWVDQMLKPLIDSQVVGVRGVCKTHQTESIARLVQCEFEERYDRQESLRKIDLIDSSSAAFRVAILRAIGGFDPAYPKADNEDVELSYRLEQLGYRLAFNRRAVVIHHHPTTWKAFFQRKTRRGYWRMQVYRYYPGKAVYDSYTPQLLKFQVMLMYIGIVCLGLMIFFPPAGWGVLLALAGILVSAIQFSRRASENTTSLRWKAYLFVLVRAFAFCVGIIGGIFGMVFFRSQRDLDTGKGA